MNTYPRWRKSGRSELFYPFRDRWYYQVHHGLDHPDGRFVARGGKVCKRFTSAEEAKQFCEDLYHKEHDRQKFDFETSPVPRLASGTQKVVLQCPSVRGRSYTGGLTVRWNPKYATVRWDYGGIDGAYPQCEIFRDCLIEANWDRELIRRLIDVGWGYHLIDRLSMRWWDSRGVDHEIAQWIMDTLPGVYQKACGRYEEVQAERVEHFFDPPETAARQQGLAL
jgi:hypothetical protein